MKEIEEGAKLIDPGIPTEYCLHTYEQLPLWLRDNAFIRSGYRVNFPPHMCFQSIFRVHNETACVWTHLFGVLVFVGLMCYTFLAVLENPSPMEYFVWTVFLLCAITQFMLSWIFHCFYCVSPNWQMWLARADYSGISFMITGSYYPVLFYGFDCWSVPKYVYIGIISLLGLCGVCVSSLSFFATPNYRRHRAGFFIIFGFFAVFPVPHLFILTGFHFTWQYLRWQLLAGALYVGGAAIYVARVPERWSPGQFDLFGSHAIWHIFVLAAGFFQWFSAHAMYMSRRTAVCPA